MIQIDWSSIILGVIGLVSSCGWLIDHRRHKHAIESLRIDNERKKLDLAAEFATKYRELIMIPQEAEIERLRNDNQELREAIRAVRNCHICASCPFRKRLCIKDGDRKKKGKGSVSGLITSCDDRSCHHLNKDHNP